MMEPERYLGMDRMANFHSLLHIHRYRSKNSNFIRYLLYIAPDQKSGWFAVGTAAALPAIANSRVFSAQTTSRHGSAPRR
jgi:hypothetical protein